jgi:hypothetical protein
VEGLPRFTPVSSKPGGAQISDIFRGSLVKVIYSADYTSQNLYIFTQKGSFRVGLGKADTMLMLQQVDCTLLRKEKYVIPWSGNYVKEQCHVTGLHH